VSVATVTSLRPTAVPVYPGELVSGDRIIVGTETMTVDAVLRDTGARSGTEFFVVTARAPGRRPVELLCGERDAVLRLEVA
jgi:hypothetical protein